MALTPSLISILSIHVVHPRFDWETKNIELKPLKFIVYFWFYELLGFFAMKLLETQQFICKTQQLICNSPVRDMVYPSDHAVINDQPK